MLSGIALSLSLAASAAPTIAFNRQGPVDRIEPGVTTKDDVRAEFGRPMSVHHVANETHYYYKVEDRMGERALLDVTFDENGYVIRKGEQRG
jgi:outer membrane protein assembly factor BamE (lipoprotein component of BamABCDE complex)